MINQIRTQCALLDATIAEIDEVKQLASHQVSSIMRKINAALNILADSPCDGSVRVDLSERCRTLRTLNKLHKAVKRSPSLAHKLQAIEEKIFRIQTAIKSAPLAQPTQRIQQPRIAFPMAFYCDLDAADYNQAISCSIPFALAGALPFITAPSLLCMQKQAVEKLLLDMPEAWEIFQQRGHPPGEGLLVFLPASIFPGVKGADKLKAFDLRGDLEPIDMKTALRGSQGKCSFDAFKQLFSPQSVSKKAFYLAGHGGKNLVGGLSTGHFLEFQQLLKEQKCQALIIDSCYAGGESSLLHHSQRGQEAHRMLTIVKSIGDYPTKEGEKADEDIVPLLSGLIPWMKDSGRHQTRNAFRKVVERVEGPERKTLQNFMQISFPHSGGGVGHFRAVGEHQRVFPLTSASVKRAELNPLLAQARDVSEGHERACRPGKILPTSPHIESAKWTVPALQIHEAECIAVHPLIVPISLVCTNSQPILLSQTPGNGRHFIRELHLAGEETASGANELSPPFQCGGYFKKMMKWHRDAELGAAKVFFIKRLSSPFGSISNAVLFVSEGLSFAIWQDGTHFYLMNEAYTAPEEISAFRHALLIDKVKKATAPDSSVNAFSSEDLEREHIEKVLERKKFITSSLYRDLFKGLATPSEDAKSAFMAKVLAADLSDPDKIELLFRLIEEHPALALKLINAWSTDPNGTNMEGMSLLVHAIIARLNGKTPFADELQALIDHLLTDERCIVLGRDISALCLQLCKQFSTAGVALLQRLLTRENVDVNAKDAFGHTPLYYALQLPDDKAFDILVKKGADIDLPQSSGLTLMGAFAESESYVDYLLLAGANPDRGTHSPLCQAIRNGHITIVSLLIEDGADPFHKDEHGNIPIVEAILYAAPETVAMLLKDRYFNSDVQDKDGITPFAAALISGDEEKMALIKRSLKSSIEETIGDYETEDGLCFQATFLPEELSQTCTKALQHMIYRCLKTGESAKIKELLQYLRGQWTESAHLEWLIADMAIRTLDPAGQSFIGLLKELVRELLITPNATNKDIVTDNGKPREGKEVSVMQLLFEKIAAQSVVSAADFDLLELCLSLHADPCIAIEACGSKKVLVKFIIDTCDLQWVDTDKLTSSLSKSGHPDLIGDVEKRILSMRGGNKELYDSADEAPDDSSGGW